MTNALKNVSILLLGMALAVALSFALTTEVKADDGEDHSETAETTAETTSENTEEAPASDNFSLTAQDGDSYTKIARKSVQIYGIENSVNLSGAEIIFVETNLAQLAGSPEIDLGEQVEIEKSVVADWVEKAQALTDSEEAAWATYVDSVDFNTDAVGQAS